MTTCRYPSPHDGHRQCQKSAETVYVCDVYAILPVRPVSSTDSERRDPKSEDLPNLPPSFTTSRCRCQVQAWDVVTDANANSKGY